MNTTPSTPLQPKATASSIIYDATMSPLPPSEATIGFFDGVHRGHCFLLERLATEAREHGRLSLAITFDRHPQQVVHPDFQPQLLTTLDERVRLLAQTGIDHIVVLPFDYGMAQLSAREFMQQVLHRRLGVQRLILGYDNRFGHRQPNQCEGFDDYVEYGRQMNIEVVQAPSLQVGDKAVSSSLIRGYVAKGEVALAHEALGRPYTIEGLVTDGHREGRKIGFPTANLSPQSVVQLMPGPGVYAVTVRLPQHDTMMPAMMNIGCRPTYGGTTITAEVHVLHFHGNLYGERLQVAFLQRLRGERYFESPDQLATQLAEDRMAVEQIVKNIGL